MAVSKRTGRPSPRAGRTRDPVLKVRMGNRLDGGVVPRVARGAVIFREPGSWAYIAGNRQGLRALHYALGRVLASRTIEIFEGPGYTVMFDRHTDRRGSQ